jgi:hypothetical protein
MRTDFEGPRGFAAASADAEAQLSTIAAYREAAAARRPQPEILERIGLWNADPDSVLTQAAASFTAGDLRATMAGSSYAKAIWSSAAEIGRNRIAAAVALTAALLLGSWLLTRWYRDRVTRRRHRQMARRV